MNDIVERDIYEVANQLGGYVGPDTPERLKRFLLKEEKAAVALADEIVRLRSELANARNTALEEAAALIDRTPICELQRTNEDRPERIFEIAAGTQSIHDAQLVRSLKAEGESR